MNLPYPIKITKVSGATDPYWASFVFPQQLAGQGKSFDVVGTGKTRQKARENLIEQYRNLEKIKAGGKQ